MAYRQHVGLRTIRNAVGLALFAAIVTGCKDQPPKPVWNRAQVIDQDTGQPIAGVVVVGKYRGSRGFEGASSCNRVESAVSDENGWFALPVDVEAGPLYMEGYHRDYRHGYPTRNPICGIDGDPEKCQIWVSKRDDNDKVVSVVKEPTIYRGRAEAEKAARSEQDVYLKRFTGDRRTRLQELWRLEGATSCGASPKSSNGLVPLLEAILNEQGELHDGPDKVRDTIDSLRSAKDALLHGK
jgi:hypothetical protein